MGSLARKAIGGSIHKIREFELEKVSLAEEFDILQIVGEGWFGKILLVEHKATDTEMVLKALPKPYTALRDFYREFHYGLHLGAHRNIVTTYDVAFETAGFYVFSQEYAPLGDLTSNVSETGIGELHTKRVARQLASALEHLHSRDLVHRDVKLDNILVFKSDFSRVKLCDFGETRRSSSVVRRHNEWLPYAPPEVLITANDDMYKTVTSHDVWQFAIVVFVCLTGCLPWQKAASDDPRYTRYVSWHSTSIPIRRVPKLFKLVSSKAQRLFRKFLEPNVDKRPITLSEVHRYLNDRWLAKNSAEKNNGLSTEDDGLCPSMYSFHSSPEEKNKLLHSLTQYGIETTVDRGAKKDRIRAWIECSVIEEEDELQEDEDSEDEERVGIMDNETGPVGERMNRGPIEDKRQQVVKDSARIEKQKRRERRLSAISRRASTVYTPPIDPRIPLEIQRFSKSEINLNRNYLFPSENHIDMDLLHTHDDTTVMYNEVRTESQADVKVGDIKHALPLQNLAAINGNSKDSSPPKENENSQIIISSQQNSPTGSQSFPTLKQDFNTQAPTQNGNSQSLTSSQQNSPNGSQQFSSFKQDMNSQSPKQNGNSQNLTSSQQNSPNGSQQFSSFKQDINSQSPKQNGNSQSLASSQQNSPNGSQHFLPSKQNTNTQMLRQIGLPHNEEHQLPSNGIDQSQQRRVLNSIKIQQPQLPVNSDLVANRGKFLHNGNGNFNKYIKSSTYKKKPMKERFEAYGGFEEKSNASNSTGRSTSK